MVHFGKFANILGFVINFGLVWLSMCNVYSVHSVSQSRHSNQPPDTFLLIGTIYYIC